MVKLNDQEKSRRNKLPKYYELGIDPFGSKYIISHSISEIREKVSQKIYQIENNQKLIEVSVAGRIRNIRCMGKASFFNIQDQNGNIQCYISVDNVGEKVYQIFKLADIGDIVGVKGFLMFTRLGELTIKVCNYTHLVKALKPFPEKYHGLLDIEERYRHRYIDLIFNEKAKKNALLRPKIIREIQKFCDALGFIEVETSIFSAIPGGADAKPFITHHNSLNKDFYLRIATELPLKKLLVGGLEKVYEIGRLFRNEGIDHCHNPEFTTIELYQAYGDLSDMKEIVENLINTIVKNLTGSEVLEYDGQQIHVTKPFKYVSMIELIKNETGIDFSQKMNFEDACKIAKKHNVNLDSDITSVGQIISIFFETFCEKKIIQPTFVHTYPIEISPLTKKSKDPRFVERFELFINGQEFANAYTELNDPIDQRERLINQIKNNKNTVKELDNDFLEAMEYGMPPAGGVGIGIDRLVMLICNEKSIREVILFPTMKSHLNNQKSKKNEKCKIKHKSNCQDKNCQNCDNLKTKIFTKQ